MGKVTYKPLRIRVTDAGKSEMNRIAAEVIRDMNQSGISASGSPFPPGKTRMITMHESGRLHRDFEAYTTRLQYKAPYAARWQAEYNWCGIPISGPWREEYVKRCQAVFDRSVVAE